MLHDVDRYSNLTVGVSLVNSAGLESVVEHTLFVGSKYSNVTNIVVNSSYQFSCLIGWASIVTENSERMFFSSVCLYLPVYLLHPAFTQQCQAAARQRVERDPRED